MSNPVLDLIEFQRLCDSRELAALNCVNAIQFVLAMFEAQDFEQSRAHLQKAFDQYREADDQIIRFYLNTIRKSVQGESSDGHATEQSA